MSVEIWKTVPDFNQGYQASNLGRIRSKDKFVEKRHKSGSIIKQFYPGKLLKPYSHKRGNQSVHIGFDGRRINVSVHRMVLMAFVGLPGEGEECCHNNGDASDNRIENLRWDTHYENNQDRKKHGTYPRGQDHPMAKHSPELIKKIKNGMKYREAIDSGMSHSQFYRIKNGESWAEL